MVSMSKQEFIDEIAKRGAIDYMSFDGLTGTNRWIYDARIDRLSYSDEATYYIEICGLSEQNPPVDTLRVKFYDYSMNSYVDVLPRVWVVARIDELLFVVELPKTVTFNSVPAGATVTVD